MVALTEYGQGEFRFVLLAVDRRFAHVVALVFLAYRFEHQVEALVALLLDVDPFLFQMQ